MRPIVAECVLASICCVLIGVGVRGAMSLRPVNRPLDAQEQIAKQGAIPASVGALCKSNSDCSSACCKGGRCARTDDCAAPTPAPAPKPPAPKPGKTAMCAIGTVPCAGGHCHTID